MIPIQILALSGIFALVAAIVYARRMRPNKKIINQARQRALARASGDYSNIPLESGEISVEEFDPHALDLTPSQLAICDLMEAGFMPEIKRDGYKYKGAPFTKVAGVPENYGSIQ